MTDERDPRDRLERAGRSPVPSVDQAFADRLETELRMQHAELGSSRRRLPVLAWPRVLAVAAGLLLVVAGFTALSRTLDDQPAVSLDVTDQPETGEVDDGSSDGAEGDDPVASGSDDEVVVSADVTATPTPIMTPTPTTVRESSIAPDPTAVPEPTPEVATPVPTEPSLQLPAATATPEAPPTATPTPTETPTSTPVPTVTAVPSPTATPQPQPATPVPLPTVTPTPAPTSTPTPTPTPTQVASLDLTCAVRATDAGVGVMCEWTAAGAEIDGYRVARIRNGGPREILATLAPDETTFVDRSVRRGDSLIYGVVGVSGDAVVIESGPIAVVVPS